MAITGGLGVCCYNLRFFSKNTLFMKQWGGYNLKSGLQSALASGILGLVCALVALVAFVLLIIGFNKKIVSVIFIVSAVLYIGELIPESVFLAKYQYVSMKSEGSVEYYAPPKAAEVKAEDEDGKWANGVFDKWAQAQTDFQLEDCLRFSQSSLWH